MTSPTLVRPSLHKSSKTSLSDLPNELLVHICESAPSDYDEQCKTFASLAKVNHHFHSIATPLLYREFYACCAKHTQLFGRTILSNAGRAELVKYFGDRRDKLINPSGRVCPMVWNVFTLDYTVEDALMAQCPYLSAPITPAVFTYALTRICPNLQQLDVSSIGNLFMSNLLAEAESSAMSLFQQLRILSIAVEGDRAYHMHRISVLFTIASLRSLTIDMAALSKDEELMTEPVQTKWLCRRGSSSLQELTLERCGLPVTWVTEMILSCKTLRHFHLEHYYWDYNTTYYPQTVRALQMHKGTLSDIRINELNGCKVASATQPDPLVPISFEEFTSLKHLDIPLFSLSIRTHHREITEFLPPGLLVLTLDLRSAREGFSDGFFISLASAIASHLTQLKSVEVICRIEQYDSNGYLPLHFCHLRKLFSSYGVEFVYFLEFVQCEFKAGKTGTETYDYTTLTDLQLIWNHCSRT
jgi:hypothetical protein